MEKKTEKLQDKFAEIADEVESYERRKKWGRFFHSMGGWLYLLIGLAVLVGIGFGLYLLWPMLMDIFAKKVGATQ